MMAMLRSRSVSPGCDHASPPAANSASSAKAAPARVASAAADSVAGGHAERPCVDGGASRPPRVQVGVDHAPCSAQRHPTPELIHSCPNQSG